MTPPFAVVNTRPSSSVTVARLGLDALTAVMLASAGALAPNQPFFVRRNTRPLSPTTHATSAFTKTLARIGRFRRVLGCPRRPTIIRRFDDLIARAPHYGWGRRCGRLWLAGCVRL